MGDAARALETLAEALHAHLADVDARPRQTFLEVMKLVSEAQWASDAVWMACNEAGELFRAVGHLDMVIDGGAARAEIRAEILTIAVPLLALWASVQEPADG